jgi:hypothetical protein
MDGKNPEISQPAPAEQAPSTSSSPDSQPNRPGVVTRRTFIKGLGGLAALATGLFGKASPGEARVNPAVRDENPTPGDPNSTNPYSSEGSVRVESSPNPQDGVPADPVDLNNIYVKQSVYTPETPTEPGNNSNDNSDEVPPASPIEIDGNHRGPDGEDVLPMVPHQPGGDVVALANPENGPLPLPNKNEPDPLPLIVPKNKDEYAMSDPTTGALPVPDETKPEVLPLKKPDSNGPVNA